MGGGNRVEISEVFAVVMNKGWVCNFECDCPKSVSLRGEISLSDATLPRTRALATQSTPSNFAGISFLKPRLKAPLALLVSLAIGFGYYVEAPGEGGSFHSEVGFDPAN